MSSQQDKAEQDIWSRTRYQFLFEIEQQTGAGKRKASNSLSGKESNQLFLAQQGNFVRASAISGADTRQDGRGFALLDYDQDGWTDLVQINLTNPRVRLLRNEFSSLYPDRQSISLSLIGTQSNRDAIGAVVDVEFSDQSIQRLHVQSGRGFATQSSRKISIATSQNRGISKISVRWPSGAITRQQDINSTVARLIIEEPEK